MVTSRKIPQTYDDFMVRATITIEVEVEAGSKEVNN